jgi:hypothetical protein
MQHKESEQTPQDGFILQCIQHHGNRLDVAHVVKYGGTYLEESNARAKTTENRIYYNQKYLGISQNEQERVVVHELQHVQTHELIRTGTEPQIAAFVFHHDFEDLHNRMKQHFLTHRARGYPFAKKYWEISADIDEERVRFGLTYSHHDEVLALLRGYALFIGQQLHSKRPVTEPYEFIEAFLPQDMKLLNPEYRKNIAAQVLKSRPSLFK